MKDYDGEFNYMGNFSLMQELAGELYQVDWNLPCVAKIDDAQLAFGVHPGARRARNEDRAAVAKICSGAGQSFSVAIVCDGVGGLEGGDIAASIAVSACISYIARFRSSSTAKDLLPLVIRAMDISVRKVLEGRGATTACVLLVSSTGEFAAASIGDSRIFSWDIFQKKLCQISVDDTLENELRNIRNADVSMLRQRGIGGSLSQALGELGRQADDLNIVIHDRESFSSGLVMASDGVWKVSSDAFEAVVSNSPSAIDAVRRVLAISSWMGGVDNSAIVAIKDISAFIKWAASPEMESSRTGFTAWFGDTKLVRRGGMNLARQEVPESRDFETESGKPKRKGERKIGARSKEDEVKKRKIQLEIEVDDETLSQESPRSSRKS